MMMKYLQDLSQQLNLSSILEYPKFEINKMAKCSNGPEYKKGDSPCVTVGYSIIGDPQKNADGQYAYIHDLMQIVADKNDL